MLLHLLTILEGLDPAAKLTPICQSPEHKGDCSLGSAVTTNPVTNPQAALEGQYKDGHRFDEDTVA